MTGCGSTPVEDNKDKDTDKFKVETIKPEEVKKIVDDYKVNTITPITIRKATMVKAMRAIIFIIASQNSLSPNLST